MNKFLTNGQRFMDWLVKCARWAGFLIFYLFDSFLLGLATDLVKHGQPGQVNQFIGLTLIVAALVLGFTTWRYQRQLAVNNPRHFGKKAFNVQRLWQLIGLFILMMAVQYTWSYLIHIHVLSSPTNQTAINNQVVQLPLWNLAYTILFAPVIEELIFRGIFLNYFFSKNTRLMNFLGVFISGLIFGAMHVPNLSWTWLMYSTLGWILGFTYLHFRDIRYNTILHFLNNAMSLL
ncbi:metal-dependent membrane protease [Levilactobacillus senmaizukei DSM 21775 = NBRC 103853]|uniref:Metal-dependent membrane protease n=1 Tax=Levilactobacillus senmaizukei DSM 21775 = NBRC 103853 TaxID=1423803 RepID=A0A0R2DDW7_9LACO|nr:type II CAAX endopeptidase family protein [Levilactobacillus senmaizukei]KRN01131.1 metal-dependent membrane protease [Levilactobacillus senmaizukei DSM 21775 = NBRC 103853]